MPKLEKYLRLDPSGELSWITIDREHFLEGLYEAIGCTCVEHVQLLHDLECIVDESGFFHDYQKANLYASPLYAGWDRGVPLVGPVVFVRTGFAHNRELDWFPLGVVDLMRLHHYLHLPIPDQEVAV